MATPSPNALTEMAHQMILGATKDHTGVVGEAENITRSAIALINAAKKGDLSTMRRLVIWQECRDAMILAARARFYHEIGEDDAARLSIRDAEKALKDARNAL